MTQSTSPAWPDDHTFLGKSTDTGTSLVDVGARKYDSSTGRFISGDPIFQPNSPQTIGGYAYAGNDPVNGSDPTGLDPHTCAPGYHHDSSSGSMRCVPDSSGGSTTNPGPDPTPHAQCPTGLRWNGHSCVPTDGGGTSSGTDAGAGAPRGHQYRHRAGCGIDHERWLCSQ
ncbi:RHS repeat-associated core domain-containing protein [Catenulispora pinisilvae]|uniref:RHS repeat-associated core domain-containing protein n=1 Tax=Catenulispora pinisilvae TaxID=2705253 RepID=UPI0018910713